MTARGLSRIGISALALATVASLSVGTPVSRGAGSPCSTEAVPPSFELVYSLHPGKEEVTPGTRERAVAIICTRLRELGVGVGTVQATSGGDIRVLLPDPEGGADERLQASELAKPGQLRFYDWEANLIGPELTIGGIAGRPSRRALRVAENEWKAAGRSVRRASNARLIRAGAFPSAYGAVRLASRQPTRRTCAACSATTGRFYAFARSPKHRLLGGPTADKAALRRASPGAILLKVPIGTVVASELPSGRDGTLLRYGEPGWYALKDRPALTSLDIVRPMEESNEFGEPAVTFGFTRKGRKAFEQLTLAIALRGRILANGPVTAAEAETLSGHMAVVFDDEVKTRPIINFRYFPHGIDGRTGAQISGGFANAAEARDLAAILSVDPLPIELELMGTKKLGGV